MSKTENRDPIRTNFRIEPVGDSAWKATEPAAESDLWGRGSTPHEAVKHYVELVSGDSA